MVLGGGGLEWWLSDEGRNLMNDISVLVRETPSSSLIPSSMGGHSEKTAIHESGSRSSPDIESSSATILDYPASELQKKKKKLHLLFKLPSIWCFLYSNPNRSQHEN